MGYVLWMLGPTSAGKTTLADALCSSMRESGQSIVHLDGDEVRDQFGENHGFRPEDRLLVVKLLTLFANKSVSNGLNVVVSALTANPDARDYIEENIPNLLICHVTCPIAECAKRDPKGLYARAERGEIKTLIGYNEPYIAPANPNLTIDTSVTPLDAGVDRIISFLNENSGHPAPMA